MSEQKKALYGVIGFPIAHSLSPEMQNAAFTQLGIAAEYDKFEVKPEELEKFLLKDVFSLGISGFNITIPHKVQAKQILEVAFPFENNYSLVQDTSYYVQLSGAVNTVKRDGNKLLYWNTDASGFLRVLEEKFKFSKTGNIEVLLLGCGGAGRAIIAALSWINSFAKQIYVSENNAQIVKASSEFFFSQLERGDILKEKIKFIAQSDIAQTIEKCQLLVNATPIGMKAEEPSAIDKSLLHRGLSVFDIVYNRSQETNLIKDAKAMGLPVADGLEMLLYQGADAFELWTGEKAPLEKMREALNKGAERK
ncbi:MAG: shikimate dehydrogenase [Candidatus Omnitrophica bacterium]|nr:shikimate dehydrogenase [Candidatus Omnitrophota bacterium]